MIYVKECSCKSFIVFGLTCTYLIYFEFTFVYRVRKCSNFILLHVAFQFSQHHLLKRLSFLHGTVLPRLSNIRCPQVYGFTSGLPILFHWSVFMFLSVYHTFLMTVALYYRLKRGRLIPPAPSFFLKIDLIIWALLCSHTNCEIFCSSSVKNTIGNLIEIELNLQTALGIIAIFIISILPIEEYDMALHLFMSSLISFINILQFSVAQRVKHLPAIWKTWVRSLGQEDPQSGNPLWYSCLENPMGGEACCRLQPLGFQRVGHN